MGLWKRIVRLFFGPGMVATNSVVVMAPTAGGYAADADEKRRETTEEALDAWWSPPGDTITEPPEIIAPVMTAELQALENLLFSHLDGHNLNLPPLPSVPERVLRRLADSNCSMAAIANDVSEDPVIAAALLRTVNSPYYRGVERVTALKPAVTRLGIRGLRSLMIQQSLRAAVFNCKGGAQQVAAMLWKRALASGCIMRELSVLTRLNPDEAFLIGLLHDIGNVVVLREVHSQEKYTHHPIDMRVFDFLCSQCHQEFGELIAEEWKLPDNLKALIANHHAFPAPGDPWRTERLQLMAADMIGALLGYGPAAPYDLLRTRAAIELGLHEKPGIAKFLAGLPEVVREHIDL